MTSGPMVISPWAIIVPKRSRCNSMFPPAIRFNGAKLSGLFDCPELSKALLLLFWLPDCPELSEALLLLFWLPDCPGLLAKVLLLLVWLSDCSELLEALLAPLPGSSPLAVSTALLAVPIALLAKPQSSVAAAAPVCTSCSVCRANCSICVAESGTAATAPVPAVATVPAAEAETVATKDAALVAQGMAVWPNCSIAWTVATVCPTKGSSPGHKRLPLLLPVVNGSTIISPVATIVPLTGAALP